MADDNADRNFEEALDEVIAEAEQATQDACADHPEHEECPDCVRESKEATEAAEAEEVEEAEAAEANSVEAQLAERTEDLQRVTAEYANFRRRTERDRGAVIETAKVQVVSELLPILDDLELAAKHGDLEGPLKSVNDKLRAALNKFKVEEFGAEGDAFDPERHEAVQDLSNGDEKVLGTVLRRGYALGERIVRTAMVIIADPTDEAHASETE